MVVRLAITIFCVVCIILTGLDESNGETKWFIYLTNWSFAILNVALILLTVLSISKTYQVYHSEPQADDYGTFETSVEVARRQEDIELPSRHNTNQVMYQPTPFKWYHQVTWLICNVSFCAAIIVTIAYWLFQAKNVGFLDVVTHAFNTIFVLVEVLLGCVPIHLLHCPIYNYLFNCLYYLQCHLLAGRWIKFKR